MDLVVFKTVGGGLEREGGPLHDKACPVHSSKERTWVRKEEQLV